MEIREYQKVKFGASLKTPLTYCIKDLDCDSQEFRLQS